MDDGRLMLAAGLLLVVALAGVPGHRLPSGVGAGDEVVEVIDEHAGMSFTSRPELMLDPEVQFDRRRR